MFDALSLLTPLASLFWRKAECPLKGLFVAIGNLALTLASSNFSSSLDVN